MLLLTDCTEFKMRGKRQKIELKLNLSPPTVEDNAFISSSSPSSPTSASLTSPPTSCLSSEIISEEGPTGFRLLQQNYSPCTTPRPSTSTTTTAHSMVLVGCPTCLMYVMFSEDDPKCPRCNTTVVLDFLKHPDNINATNKRGR